MKMISTKFCQRALTITNFLVIFAGIALKLENITQLFQVSVQVCLDIS